MALTLHYFRVLAGKSAPCIINVEGSDKTNELYTLISRGEKISCVYFSKQNFQDFIYVFCHGKQKVFSCRSKCELPALEMCT